MIKITKYVKKQKKKIYDKKLLPSNMLIDKMKSKKKVFMNFA